MKNFSIAVFNPIRAIGYTISHPGLWLYIGVTILTNIVITIALIWLFSNGIVGLVTNILAQLLAEVPAWVTTASYVLGTLASIILVSILFNSISMTVNSTIYSNMVEKILDNLQVRDVRNRHPFYLQPFVDAGYSLLLEIKKGILFILFLLLSLVINIIPGLGQLLSFVLQVTGLIVFNGIDLFDPALSRKQLRFRTKLSYIGKFPTSWPTLIVFGILNSIPIMNIVTLPISLVAAALIYQYKPMPNVIKG